MSTGKYSDGRTETTHFGFEQVRVDEKAGRIAEVFDTVSPMYDIMNDLMSFGTHRVVKWYAIKASNIKPGSKVLDIAAGTGDLTILISKRVGAQGSVILSDINEQVLQGGVRGLHGPISPTMCSFSRQMPKTCGSTTTA